MVDAARLRQVLINLAGNGVKFTETGGVTLSARARATVPTAASASPSPSPIRPGHAPSEAERLFGEFEQIDTALNRRHGGAGLGLAISRRIVRRMGGDIARDAARRAAARSSPSRLTLPGRRAGGRGAGRPRRP